MLIDDQGTALVADFGLARLHSLFPADSNHPSGPVGTIHWLAPEILVEERFTATIKSDVWAFSMTLYELYTDGQIPFADIPDSHSLHLHLKDGGRPVRPADPKPSGGELAWKLMQRCWAFSPKERPTVSWILIVVESLYPVFQTHDLHLLVEAPTKFRNVEWSESIFSQWPQGLSALSDLLMYE